MAKYIVCDVESYGPIIGINSMVCFGAVLVDRNGLQKTFYGQTKPIQQGYNPDALAISGFTRQEHEKFDDPHIVMKNFAKWIKEVCGDSSPVLVSDNNGYDASWINFYFQVYNNSSNPFGWSSRRIGDMYAGFMNDSHYKWKKHRKTSHTHHPVDDVKGNAEALLYLIDQGFKLKIS
jgi:hypothetical protein